MEVGYLPTIPQQLHENCPQISIKVVKLSSFEVSKNSGKTFARSTTLSKGEKIGCERPLVTLLKRQHSSTKRSYAFYPFFFIYIEVNLNHMILIDINHYSLLEFIFELVFAILYGKSSVKSVNSNF